MTFEEAVKIFEEKTGFKMINEEKKLFRIEYKRITNK